MSLGEGQCWQNGRTGALGEWRPSWRRVWDKVREVRGALEAGVPLGVLCSGALAGMTTELLAAKLTGWPGQGRAQKPVQTGGGGCCLFSLRHCPERSVPQ